MHHSVLKKNTWRSTQASRVCQSLKVWNWLSIATFRPAQWMRIDYNRWLEHIGTIGKVAASISLNVEHSITFLMDGCQWIWCNRIPSQPKQFFLFWYASQGVLTTWYAKKTNKQKKHCPCQLCNTVAFSEVTYSQTGITWNYVCNSVSPQWRETIHSFLQCM